MDIKDININTTSLSINIRLSQIRQGVQRAQFHLDTQIMNDMLPLMPLDTGNFQQRTRASSMALAGTGEVIAAERPMGRYLYYGKVMVDSQTGKGPRKIPMGGGDYILRFRKGAKLVPTARPIKYSRPGAVPLWFEEAKKLHLKQWVDIVGKEIINGR